MRQRLMYPAVLAFLLTCGSNAVQAQLVQIGPGFVKAPFVRVEWSPDGGSYVRAPFVEVMTPGYGARTHWAQVPVIPAEPDFAAMDYPSLRRAIRGALAAFDAELDKFSTTGDWETSLNTAVIDELVTLGESGPPSDEARAHLNAIVKELDAVRHTQGLESISHLLSFQRLRAAIGEFVLPTEARLLRQLVGSAGKLNQTFDGIATGPGWQSYLNLSTIVNHTIDPVVPDELERQQLVEILRRFEAVSDNEKFSMMGELPGFLATRQHLASYLDFWEYQARPSGPKVEELPRPNPE